MPTSAPSRPSSQRRRRRSRPSARATTRCARPTRFSPPCRSSLTSRSCTQDFVGSVSALLRVRQGTVSLKHRVVELNDDIQKSGGGVADKARLFSPSAP